MPNNFFGKRVFSPKGVLKNRVVVKAVRDILSSVLVEGGLPKSQARKLASSLVEAAKSSRSTAAYERSARGLVEGSGFHLLLTGKLAERAGIIFSQIKSHVLAGSVLDLGCGDGQVGKRLAAQGNTVSLADVYRHPEISRTDLPFKTIGSRRRLPFRSGSFDTVLLATVLHHSDDPVHLINEARRVVKLGGRVLVTESVYGVDGKGIPKANRGRTAPFLQLTRENQRLANIFFDHLYNRVFHYSEKDSGKVNVPFNFNTPDGWNSLFQANGLEHLQTVHFGADYPVVPEYHTLHVLMKAK